MRLNRTLWTVQVLLALGLILPGLFGIRTGLTPLAASGLVMIMIGATTITAFAIAVTPALVPMRRLASWRRSWVTAAGGWCL